MKLSPLVLALSQQYRKLYARLAKSIATGRFAQFTARKKAALLSRLQRYERQLIRYGGAIASAAALLLGSVTALGKAPAPLYSKFKGNTQTSGTLSSSVVTKGSNGDAQPYSVVQSLPSVTLSVSATSGTEAGTSVIIVTATASTAVTGNQTVTLGVTGAGITSGDYSLINPVITIPNGSTTASITFTVVNDVLSELTETAVLTISSPSSGILLGSTVSQQVQLIDNDFNQDAPYGSEFRVNTYTTKNQMNPVVAKDSDGDYVVAWISDGQDGSSWGIYAQRYNASGVAQGSEFRVNTYTTGFQSIAAIAMDSDGDFVVVWESDGQDGADLGIYGQRYNNTGIAQGGEFRINTYTTNAQENPSVAMAANGDFVVAWQSFAQDASSGGIYGQRYNAAGTAQGGEFRINTTTNSAQWYPSAAMSSTGDFVVAWQSLSQDGDDFGIYAQRYNAAGAAQGSEFLVNTYTTAAQQYPSVAMDSDGDFVVAWESNGQDGHGVGGYAQRYNAAGVAQGSEFRVNTFTTSNQSGPSVAIDSDGDFVVAWTSNTQDGAFDGVYGQRYNSAGTALGIEFRINTTPNYSESNPAIAMDSDGDFVVAWQSSFQDGYQSGIFAQQYTVAPRVDLSVSSNTGTEAGTTVIMVSARTGLAVTGAQTVSLAVTGTGITANDYTLSNTTITIPNGQTQGSVTFTVVNDAIDEASPETAVLTISNPSGGILLGETVSQNIAITDNDVAGITVVQSGGSTDVTEGGATDTYTVVLTSEPTADVTIAVNPNGQQTTSPTSLTFTAANWNTAQTVTVAAVDDATSESYHTGSIVHSATSSDGNYQGISIGSVLPNITDNDLPAVNLSVSANTGTEAGTTAITVTATAGAAVVGNQTVALGVAGTDITAGDYTLSNSTITILNGATQGSVTFTVVNDVIDEADPETAVLTISSPSAGIILGSTVSQNIGITDNDVAGVTFIGVDTGTALSESTGNSDTYTVQLASLPSSDVTIVIDPGDDCEISIGGGPFGPSGTITTSSLSPFNIAIRAFNDFFLEGPQTCSVSYSFSSPDPVYNALTRPNDVYNVNDNEGGPYGVTVIPGFLTSSSGSEDITPVTLSVYLTLNGSGTGPRLIETPFSVGYSVTGGTATGGGTDYALAAGSVTFNSSTTISGANASETFSLSIVDDAVDEPDETIIVTVDPNETGTSGAYDVAISRSTSRPSHTYTITDNDVPGVTITQSGGSTDIAEGGVTDSYTVVLNSQPTGNVTIGITPNGQQTTSPTSLTFTTANWNTAQTVTVTAVDDAASEGSHTGSIVHSATSGDVNYQGISIGSVTPNITDNDLPAVNLSVSANTGTEVGTTSITVTATASPAVTGNQTVALGITGTGTTAGDYTLSNNTITIPGGQTQGSVTFTVVDDALVEGPETATLAISSPSAGIVLGSTASQNVALTDNDVAFLTVTPLTASAPESSGTYSSNIQLRISSSPAGGSLQDPVTVSLAPNGLGATTPADFSLTTASVTFGAGSVNNDQQPFSVTIVNDDVMEGDEFFDIGLVRAGYTGVPVIPIDGDPDCISCRDRQTIRIGANDPAGVTITQSGGSTDIAEGGATDSYTVVLNSQPTANVTVAVAPNGQQTTSPTSLTFTAANWNTAQTVTVTAVDDAASEGNHSGNIAHSATSSDANYNGISIGGVIPNIADNDAAPEIAVFGNATLIADGTVTVIAGDHTLIPSQISGTVFTRTFTIKNDVAATGPLTVSGLSVDNAFFGIGAILIGTTPQTLPFAVPVGSEATVEVRYTAIGAGTRSATVTLTSDDTDEDTYTFRVQGSSTATGCN